MDKKQLLIDKYGLPDDLASDVISAIMQHIGAENYEAVYPTKDNLNEIEALKSAFKQYASKVDKVDTNSIIISMQPPKIKKVKFFLDDYKHITIDDPYFIGLLGKFIEQQDFILSSPRSRGNQPNPPYLKEIAQNLMGYFAGTDYSKRVKIGEIFAEFLPKFQNCFGSPVHLQKEVDNLLNQKPKK